MAATTENVDIVVAGLSRDRDVAAVTDDSVEIMSGLTALERGLYQRGVTTSACAKLFSRRVADGITFPDGLYYEDLLYCVETLRRSARVAVIGDVVYYYRDNPSSFINTFSPRRLDVLRVTARVEELLEGDEELLRAARSRRLSACFNIYGLLAVHDRDGRYSDVSCRCWTLNGTIAATVSSTRACVLKTRWAYCSAIWAREFSAVLPGWSTDSGLSHRSCGRAPRRAAIPTC